MDEEEESPAKLKKHQKLWNKNPNHFNDYDNENEDDYDEEEDDYGY